MESPSRGGATGRALALRQERAAGPQAPATRSTLQVDRSLHGHAARRLTDPPRCVDVIVIELGQCTRCRCPFPCPESYVGSTSAWRDEDRGTSLVAYLATCAAVRVLRALDLDNRR